MKNTKTFFLTFSLLFSFVMFACSNSGGNAVDKSATEKSKQKEKKDLSKLSKAYFASGCFWCVEAIFESVEGVEEAVSGYAGGKEQNPTYEQVGRAQTGHTEAVEIYYDPAVISYETLLKVFYASHNPTTVNGQAPDFGTQYRSAIFYMNDAEKKMAESYKAKIASEYKKPIATEIAKLTQFWDAEDYHQDFERKNPNQSYVRAVSVPRLNRFKAKYPELLKKSSH
ncbi:MAG: peptide-methionine (S)-S-oxide reductase [Bacteroidia bacterium]|jgi:peptide-methionine (S)-S-oxide reductase